MTTDTIIQIPIGQLHESPFNPRKTFLDIEQLAASIKAEGRVLQPLLVRPRTGEPGTSVDAFEVVFGHRRLRAAQEAGLTHVPCMVRAMTDAEARSAQIAENLSRADVHPIEEAEGFQAMIDNDGVTADELAELHGKSKSYVYGRLKLLQACPEIREACISGKIGSEVALLIARLRTDKLQQKALAAIRNDTSTSAKLDDGGKRSFRHIRDLLAEKFTLDLKSAIFDPADFTLLPDAGVCSACPKRTGNAPEYADLADKTRESEHTAYLRNGGPNLCTDPDCFDAKKQAHLEREAAKLRAKGTEVVAGNKARAAISAQGELKGDYISAADVKRALKAAGKKLELQPLVVQNPRDGKVVQAYKRSDLVAVGAMKAEAAAKTAQPKEDGWTARQKRLDAERAEQTKQNLALLHAVRQASAGRQRDAFELRLAARAAFNGVDWSDRDTLRELHGVVEVYQLEQLIETADVAALTQLLIDCILVVDVNVQYSGQKPAPLLAMAEHYGLDAKAIMAAAIEPPPPPAEAPATTPTPSTAGASAKKRGAAAGAGAASKLLAKGVRYRNPATGDTWTGRGLQPRWLKAALAGGATLDDFDLKRVKDDAGAAGGSTTTAEANQADEVTA